MKKAEPVPLFFINKEPRYFFTTMRSLGLFYNLWRDLTTQNVPRYYELYAIPGNIDYLPYPLESQILPEIDGFTENRPFDYFKEKDGSYGLTFNDFLWNRSDSLFELSPDY
jgi:hypothetical protein